MSSLLRSYTFNDINVHYILNNKGRAVLTILPKENKLDFSSVKNSEVFDNSSLVHLQLSHHNSGMLSNSFKFSETLKKLKFTEQYVEDTKECITVFTVEKADEGYGIRHGLKN